MTDPIEIVVEVGAEGGALALCRERTMDGKFAFFTLLDAMEFEDIESVHEKSDRVATLQAGFELLDAVPGCDWAKLVPITSTRTTQRTSSRRSISGSVTRSPATVWIVGVAHVESRSPRARSDGLSWKWLTWMKPVDRGLCHSFHIGLRWPIEPDAGGLGGASFRDCLHDQAGVKRPEMARARSRQDRHLLSVAE